MTRAELGRLVQAHGEHGQAYVARRLNALGASVGDICGGRRYVPELVEPSKGVAVSAGCPVTHPNGNTAPGEHPGPTFYGMRGLWTVLPRDGVLRITTTTPVPPGATFGKIDPDGSLSTKFPWWGSKSAEARLTIRGHRLDAHARRLQFTAAPGATAASPRFWPTRLKFASAGCWKIGARSRGAHLTFTISVRRAGYG